MDDYQIKDLKLKDESNEFQHRQLYAQIKFNRMILLATIIIALSAGTNVLVNIGQIRIIDKGFEQIILGIVFVALAAIIVLMIVMIILFLREEKK